jgi:hypothetical protein
MKIGLLELPTIPTTGAARQREGPIVARAARWQRMVGETVEHSRMAEDLGFALPLWGTSRLRGEILAWCSFHPSEQPGLARCSPRIFFSFVHHSFTKGR